MASIVVLLIGAFVMTPSGSPMPNAIVAGIFTTKAECEAERKEALISLRENEHTVDKITSYGVICQEVPILRTIPKKGT